MMSGDDEENASEKPVLSPHRPAMSPDHRYHMSPYHNTKFYVAFCFMINESMSDYSWVLTQLRSVYREKELPHPMIIVTDMERGLMTSIEDVFPSSTTNYLLFLWHINNNVIVNCKKHFNNKEAWNVFFTNWKLDLYASSESEFWKTWKPFSNQYQ